MHTDTHVKSAGISRKWLRPVVAIVGYAVIAYLAFRAMDRTRMAEGFALLRPQHLVLLLGIALLHIAGRAFRYHRLLLRARPHATYRWADGFLIFLIGLSTSAVTPARVGDLVKAKLVRPFGIGTSSGVGLVMIERVLDLLVMCLTIVGMGMVLSDRPASGAWSRTAALLLVVLILGPVAIGHHPIRGWGIRVAARALRAVRPSLASKVETTSGELFGVWDTVFASPATFAVYVASSCAVWALDFCKLWLVVRMLGGQASLAVCFFIYPVSLLAGVLTLLPFSEGVVGVTGVALLSSIGQVDSSTAILAVAFDRSVSSIPPLVLAGAFALASRRRAQHGSLRE
ncbi:flippase-like domain-containing protein [Pendulispora brunnea]|uniref:Flippase-like domain-containing protein n=1 Tax=Pendulispora brunnea TaxID=2905690 RepID=A0ABZ2KI49_9BACT